MDRSAPGLPVHHQLPEFTEIHVHGVGDTIQPSHPLSSPSPPAPNPSQHQGLFQGVSSLHQVAKGLEPQIERYIYIHPLPLEPPSHPIPPSGSSQSAKLSSLLCRAACHYFTPDSVYMSVLLSSFAPLPPSHAAPQVCSLLRISIPALQIGLSVQFF